MRMAFTVDLDVVAAARWLERSALSWITIAAR